MRPICNIPAPGPDWRRNSRLRLTTAMGLAGVDTSRLSSYSEVAADGPVLIGLRDKVSLDFRAGIPNTFTEIELSLRDGSRFTAQHDAGIPGERRDAAGRGWRRNSRHWSIQSWGGEDGAVDRRYRAPGYAAACPRVAGDGCRITPPRPPGADNAFAPARGGPGAPASADACRSHACLARRLAR